MSDTAVLEHLISEELLKGFHKEMMADPLQWESNDIYNNIGDYRHDGAGALRPNGPKIYMEPYHIRPAMRDFISELGNRTEELDENSPETHPVNLATWAHLKFLGDIHPFKDGNGRVGRIIIAMILMKSGYPHFIPTDKDEYLNAVYQSSLEEPDQLELFIATTLRDLMAKQLVEVKA
jgi:Fic family protein